MDKRSLVEQLGPYVVAVVGILVGAVAPWLARKQAAEGRAFDARIERARYMRSALAEGQMASASFGHEVLLIAIAHGQMESGRVEADVRAAMDASQHLRELAAMTRDQEAADLLKEAVERIHGLSLTAANLYNLRKYAEVPSTVVKASTDEQKRLLDGDPTVAGLRKLSILDLWARLRDVCAEEFGALTTG